MNRLVSSDIEAYAETHSMPESSVCCALREETAADHGACADGGRAFGRGVSENDDAAGGSETGTRNWHVYRL